MLKLVHRSLLYFGKALLFLVWIGVYQPVRLLSRLFDEITGAGRKRRELRSTFQERVPLSTSAFVKESGIAADEAPIWLALRQAVGELARLPEEVIYPYDDLASLRLMMAPAPDAPWFDTGSNWADVVDWAAMILRVVIPIDKDFHTRWVQAESTGGLRTLHQLAVFLEEIIQNH